VLDFILWQYLKTGRKNLINSKSKCSHFIYHFKNSCCISHFSNNSRSQKWKNYNL